MGKSSILNQLNKIEKLIKIPNKKGISTLMQIDIDDTRYFIIDNEGNKIPISEKEYFNTFLDSKGRFKQPTDIQVMLDDEM